MTALYSKPAVGETPGTAYDGFKGKVLKDAVDKILKGETVVPTSYKLIGSNAGKNLIMGRWEGFETGIVWDVDGSPDLPVSNALRLKGYEVIAGISVYNPAGRNYVTIPLNGKDVQFALAINGNWNACAIHVTDVVRQGDFLLIFLSQALSTNVQINTMMFYPKK